MKKVLTIAGSDCSGGAGIQADLKTFAAHGVYGMSVITAVTVQNTKGVTGVHNIPPDIVKAQIDAVFSDIFPDAVKIGMVSSIEIISVISQKLEQYQPKFIVYDPVMVSTSGHRLLEEEAENAIVSTLIPKAYIITPNIPEAEVLSGIHISSKDDMVKAAELISKKHCNRILLKGGHFDKEADDLLFNDGKVLWFSGKRIQTKNTHGTGCTLSSAIASNLALGYSLEKAIENAKGYITRTLASGIKIGHGNGPVDHRVSPFDQTQEK